jgi:hypothetical protein
VGRAVVATPIETPAKLDRHDLLILDDIAYVTNTKDSKPPRGRSHIPAEVLDLARGSLTRPFIAFAPIVSRAIRARALICLFSSSPSAVKPPCLGRS